MVRIGNRRKLMPMLTLAVIVVVLTFVLLVYHRSHLALPPGPIMFRYVQPTDASTARRDEPSFWVTNCSNSTLAVLVHSVEIRTHGAWTEWAQIPPPNLLWFTNRQTLEMLLRPHVAGIGCMVGGRITLPSNAIWRVKASAAKKLNGPKAALAAVFREPQMLKIKRASGSKSLWIIPLGKGFGRFGPPSAVVSEPELSR